MATAADLIEDALRTIGAIASGESPSSAEQADALVVLNRMLRTWSTEKLMILASVREEFTLTPSTGSYTMGSSGDFDTTRPVRINRASLEEQTSGDDSEHPIEIINETEWSEIQLKATQSSIPNRLYVEMNYPLITLNLWPVPSAAHKIVLYSDKELTTYAASTTLSLAPGYEEAMLYNLCVRLAPEFGRPLDPVIVELAIKTKASVKRANKKPKYLGTDAALVSRAYTYDWRIGE